MKLSFIMHFSNELYELRQLIQSVDLISQHYVCNIPDLFSINYCQVIEFENSFCQEETLL